MPTRPATGTTEEACDAQASFSGNHWKQIVANTDAISWKEDQEAKIDVALKRCFDIISQFPKIHKTVKNFACFGTFCQGRL